MSTIQRISVNLADRLLIPRAPVVSRHAREAERIARDWASKHRLVPGNYDGYTTMSRWLYPGAVDANRLAAACIVHNLFFFIDDLFFDTDLIDPADHAVDPELLKQPERLPQMLKSWMLAFRSREVPQNAASLHYAFAEAGEFVARVAGDDTWFSYFVDTVDDYIDAVLNRDVNLEAYTQDIETFTSIRERDTGGLHTCVLIELTHGLHIGGWRDINEVHRLTRLCYRQASFINDIVSFDKDVMAEGSDFNLILVLMNSHQMSFDEAVDEAVNLVNSYVQAFSALSEAYEAPTADVRRYVEGLGDLIGGNIYWHLTTPRYSLST